MTSDGRQGVSRRSGRPVVVGPLAAWSEQGHRLVEEVRAQLGERALRVEHIGSTAVPGMAAKDVLDLQASVTDLEAAEREFGPLLEERGFRLSPYRSDHVPAGSDDDPGRWGKRLWTRRGHEGDAVPGAEVNLHVRLAGSPGERLALLFRDWFRAHPGAVPAYAAFKTVLAGAVADVGTYADVKDPVVDLVVGVAEGWAARTGWRP